MGENSQPSKIALQELSAPLIPVFEHITVMPLVGTIDTERAKNYGESAQRCRQTSLTSRLN